VSFLQPLLLVALPLAALPIIIHLINQRRYQTMRWAGMMFLLAANRMSRGYARLRQWLILAMRVAVIAALVFAVSRPLASGWVGLTVGGRADTTIILLDRSPSMQQTAVGTVTSKLETATQQLAATLSALGSSRWVLIDSVSCKPTELETPLALLNSSSTSGASASADLPAMLQAAYDYIQQNRAGRTEIWICSDLRANDWNAQSGRWLALRDAFLQFKAGVRFHLLAYPKTAPGNLSVRVAGLRRQATSDGAELLVSLHLARETPNGSTFDKTHPDDNKSDDAKSREPKPDDAKLTVPLTFEIDGARSEMSIDMTGPEFDLKDHPLPLQPDHPRGWGRVSIPADVNPADNNFYFAYDPPPPRHTLIVADDREAVRPLQVAAEITDDPAAESKAEVVSPGDLSGVQWESIGLLLWQSALPQGEAADLIRSFIAGGGQAIFFPPANPDQSANPGKSEFYGVHWQAWENPEDDISVETWRGDQDLMANTNSGAALPVGDLHVRRYCPLSGEFTPLATLHGGAPLLARVTTDHGGVYFCGTTVAAGDSSLASDGVVLFVAIQRALSDGADVLEKTHQVTAGQLSMAPERPWQHLAGDAAALSTEYPAHSGVYTAGEQMYAVNRAAAEDQAPVLSDARVTELFRGLDFVRVDQAAGGIESLAHEVWRMFLVTMMVAMAVEAGLCLPKRRPTNKTILPQRTD
jgi:hypothetical protein